MTEQKMIKIQDFLTDDEINGCIELYNVCQKADQMHNLAKLIKTHFIEPNIDRINESIGQKNDPTYLAYMVYYVLMSSDKP